MNWTFLGPGLTEKEKGRTSFPVDNKILFKLKPEEVQLLVSPPTTATGTRMRENVLSFEALASKIQLTQLKIRPDGDDGWGTITPKCREYSSSRSVPKTQVLAAIPEGTITGQVLEVNIVKIMDGYGIEVANPSIADSVNTSYVVISRETERLGNEIHGHKEKLKSSNSLLKDIQRSERSEPHGEERGTNSIKETCAPQSIKETNLCEPSQHSSYTSVPLHKKEPFLRMKGNECLFMPILQTEETWQTQSPKWLQKSASLRSRWTTT